MITSRILLALTIVAAVSISASAATMSDISFTITAESELGTGTWEVDSRQDLWSDDVYNWGLREDVEIKSEAGAVIATLRRNKTSLRLVADPVVSLNFVVSAGPAPTAITVTSALLGFPPVNGAMASASAGITVTDNNGDGASITGNYNGGTDAYLAHYNGAIPGGVAFATLVDNQSAGAFGTSTTNEAVGSTAIGVPVTSMQTQFGFTLSPFDSAAGTSVFVVIPEPATVIQLFAIVAMISVYRRSRA